MSLNFNFTNCDVDKDTLWHTVTDMFGEQEDLTAIPKVLVFTAMAIGVPNISEANKDEFWRRTEIHQDIVGSLFNYVDKDTNDLVPILLTQEDVYKYVGMKTNSSIKTKTEFRNKMRKEKEYYSDFEDKSKTERV
jgi:hypothetical protein